MKNKILSLALLLTLSFTLTACTLQDLPLIGQYFGGEAGPGAPTSGPVTLTMWGLWENPEVMNVLIKKYNDVNPNVTIVYEDRSIIKPDDYKERIVTRAGSGGDIGADILLVHNSWVPRLRTTLTAMPSSYMSADTYSTTYYPVITASGVADGKIYAVPFYYEGLVLVYNTRHFDEVGQQEAPTAWEEFRRLALKLTIRNNEGLVRSGAAIGNADNIDHFSDILGLMFAQTNVTVPQDLDSRAAVDALTFYTTFSKEDKIWDNTMPEATTAFAQEKVSMIFVPTWRILDILNANPNLEIGVAPVPQAIPERPATWASFWMLSVPMSSSNSDAAWHFIDFIAKEEQELLRYSEASKYRPFGAPYARVSLAPQLQNNLYIKPLLDTAPFARSYEIAARSGNGKWVEPLKTVVNQVLTGGNDAAAQALSAYKQGEIQ